MAKSPTALIQEFAVEFRGAIERIEILTRTADEAKRERDEERALGRERDRVNAELRQEVALHRQQLQDHLKRVEVWSGRLWALVAVLVGAVMSLAGGLIIALAKK
ncbi:MAG: hypothetical protein K2X87_10730 [Gemmataceae bacterium]|nr:hypothetical protein [Gemmataceae bacterium]